MSVKVTLIKLDGSTGTPGERDQQLLAQVQIFFATDPQFRALLKPVFDRAEVNAGQQETEDGYLYLCYQVAEGHLQAFWGSWGKWDKVAFKSGKVTVKSPS